ncbi:MAG: hypothetical protein WBE65_03200, partial [Steroidobacteraceae bacterium]
MSATLAAVASSAPRFPASSDAHRVSGRVLLELIDPQSHRDGALPRSSGALAPMHVGIDANGKAVHHLAQALLERRRRAHRKAWIVAPELHTLGSPPITPFVMLKRSDQPEESSDLHPQMATVAKDHGTVSGHVALTGSLDHSSVFE